VKRFSFHFSGGERYITKNQQLLESTHLEVAIRPQEPAMREEVWYVELVVQHVFDFQKAAFVAAVRWKAS
jgi:hypothetical protein